jgi:hypothetical protein
MIRPPRIAFIVFLPISETAGKYIYVESPFDPSITGEDEICRGWIK